jgi:exonuclease VII large subunit
MHTSPDEARAVALAATQAGLPALDTPRPNPALEAALEAVEHSLAALHEALLARRPDLVEARADELRRTLTQTLSHFMQAARNGGVPLPLRHRLARAGAQVASQRESLARATAALDRAMDALLPPQHKAPNLYGAAGMTESRPSSGSITA